jgi:hypothetical protein
MGEENGIEVMYEEEYRSVRKTFQSPVRKNVWSRILAKLETPDGFLYLVRFR